MLIRRVTSPATTLAPSPTVLPGLLLSCSRLTAPAGAGGCTPPGLRSVPLAHLRPGCTGRLMKWLGANVAIAINAPIMWTCTVLAQVANGGNIKVVTSVRKTMPEVSASAVKCVTNPHVTVSRQIVSILGTLVHIHLAHHAPHLTSPCPHTLPLVLGPSCVAVQSIEGSTILATHGVPVNPPAVDMCNDGPAVACDGVGVRAKFVARVESATSTSSSQLHSVLLPGDVVDAAAEAERRGSSAEPTTSPLNLTIGPHPMRLDGLPLVPSFGCRRRLSLVGIGGSKDLERRPTAALPGFIVSCSSCPPGLSALKCNPFVPSCLLPALLVIACAEALAAASTPWSRADSLVSMVRASG